MTERKFIIIFFLLKIQPREHTKQLHTGVENTKDQPAPRHVHTSAEIFPEIHIGLYMEIQQPLLHLSKQSLMELHLTGKENLRHTIFTEAQIVLISKK